MGTKRISGTGARRTAIALAIAAACAGRTLLDAPIALAQAPGRLATRDFNIAAEALGDALTDFGRQSGMQVSVDASLVRGKRVPALKGRMEPIEALRQLLVGTGLTYLLNGNTVTVDKLPDSGNAHVLGPLQVEGAAGSGTAAGANGSTDSTATEGTGSYTTGAVEAGGKIARDPKEIQQSISVITQQQMQDQNITDTFGALAQMTGITLIGGGGNSPTIISRGFSINNYTTDGGAAQDYFGLYGSGVRVLPDVAGYDHVEVLRGSDGMDVGIGNPSGTINLVSKKPLDHDQVLVDLLAARWDKYRTQADVTGPLLKDGSLRGRLVMADQNEHEFYKPGYSKENYVYGVLEYDLTPATLLTAGGSYQRNETLPDLNGVPRYAAGPLVDLPRDLNLTTAWSHFNDTNTRLFEKLQQDLFGDWKFKLNVSENQLLNDDFYGGQQGLVSTFCPGCSYFTGGSGHSNVNELEADTQVTGSFEILGRKQQITAGGSYQRERGTHSYHNVGFANYQSVDVFQWDSNAYAQPPVSPYLLGSNTYLFQQRALYLSFRSEIIDRLHVNGGAHWEDFNYQSSGAYYDPDTGVVTSTYSYNSNTTKTGVDSAGNYIIEPLSNGHVTPYFGATYDLTGNIAVYGSWASIFIPQVNHAQPFGDLLPFPTGNTEEFGVKGSWMHNTLNASLGVYNTALEHVGIYIGYPVQNDPTADTQCCFVSGSERSKGVDAEIKGEILPGWQLSAGYTYNDNYQTAYNIKYLSGAGAATGGGTPLVTQAPRHLFKLWTMAKLPGVLSRFRVGGGVTAQTLNYEAGTISVTHGDTPAEQAANVVQYNVHISQGGYAILSLAGSYTINDQWQVNLNVDNATDRRYLSTVAFPNGSYYGTPLDFTLAIHGKF